MNPARRSPSRATLEWLRAQVDHRATVTRVRRLMGGISSSVHAVSLGRPDGRRSTVVLRRWVGGWVDGNETLGRELVTNELQALANAERGAIPAPRAIAGDPTGADAGGPPCVVMTRVNGRVHLAPRDADRWLTAQAELLPRIHALNTDAPRSRSQPDFSLWAAPRDSRRPAIWQAAREVVAESAPASPKVFRHGDYQHFNMLWSRERLTGVVDWTFPRTGPPDLDVGHCHLNLAVLFSAERAERFRRIYESSAGREVDPWWNIVALLRYSDDWPSFIPVQVNGQIAVDTAGMTSRVEDLVDLTLRRLG